MNSQSKPQVVEIFRQVDLGPIDSKKSNLFLNCLIDMKIFSKDNTLHKLTREQFFFRVVALRPIRWHGLAYYFEHMSLPWTNLWKTLLSFIYYHG